MKGRRSEPVKEFNLESRVALDREVVEKTTAFIQARAREGRPFYIYAAFTQIHPPFLPHPDFDGQSKAGFYANIQMEVDHNVGSILDAIEQAGVEDETIVILTGDNAAGAAYGNGTYSGEGGSNGPWRGGLSSRIRGRHPHSWNDSMARSDPG